jgi:hypothetical protein
MLSQSRADLIHLNDFLGLSLLEPRQIRKVGVPGVATNVLQ